MIQVLEEGKTFHLKTAHTSMIFHAMESGHLMSLYWGKSVEDREFSYIVRDIKRASYLSGTDGIKEFRLEQYPVLYPACGYPDLRTPAFIFAYSDGSRITDLRYSAYECYWGKRKIQGLPSILSKEADCLELVLRDRLKDVEVRLIFAVFESYDAVTQSVKVINHGRETITIERLMSSCFSFLDDQFEAMTLTGAWGRECRMSREKIRQGTLLIDSKRGAGGHGQNPFIALIEENTDETHGSVWAMNLIYSGGFEAEAEVDMHQNTRLMMGIQSFGFSWTLENGQSFSSPEAVLVHSESGLGKMSRCYHSLYRECLMRGSYARKCRPILINNWEATYFDFDREKLLKLADEAERLGIELFVLDDGWFAQRNDADSSLGDWTENRQKLGGSLAELAKEIVGRGMRFGLWFEPEMASLESELYKKHPEWVIRTRDHSPQLSRNQLVLDLSRPEVQEYIIEAVDHVLNEADISYVKWDMNRNITDWGSSYLAPDRQKELLHRYILGLYRVLEELTQRHPKVLFEGCAGGGGRFDPGMLYYMPQIWASDDTDAVERLEIQYGTSFPYPAISVGCHVSTSPNHQVGRKTSIGARGVVAMQGNLGYELDLTALNEEEKDEVRKQIVFYKRVRETIQFGDFYRLEHKANERAWLYVSADGKQVVASYFRILAKPNTVPKRLKLAGLEAEALYRIEGSHILRHGSSLMNIGLDLNKVNQDFYARQWVLWRQD